MYYVVEEAPSLISGILQLRKNGLVTRQQVDIMLIHLKDMCYWRRILDKMGRLGKVAGEIQI